MNAIVRHVVFKIDANFRFGYDFAREINAYTGFCFVGAHFQIRS